MVTLHGDPISLKNQLPKIGDQAPSFECVAQDLQRIGLNAYEGRVKILNIFPSVDTEVCALSLKKFQERILSGDELVLIHLSKDLPFAFKRFCAANKQEKVQALSAFDSTFGEDYGVLIENGPLKGLLARCVFILDKENKLIYSELVSEITQEPNYGKVIEFLESYLKPTS